MTDEVYLNRYLLVCFFKWIKLVFYSVILSNFINKYLLNQVTVEEATQQHTKSTGIWNKKLIWILPLLLMNFQTPSSTRLSSSIKRWPWTIYVSFRVSFFFIFETEIALSFLLTQGNLWGLNNIMDHPNKV